MRRRTTQHLLQVLPFAAPAAPRIRTRFHRRGRIGACRLDARWEACGMPWRTPLRLGHHSPALSPIRARHSVQPQPRCLEGAGTIDFLSHAARASHASVLGRARLRSDNGSEASVFCSKHVPCFQSASLMDGLGTGAWPVLLNLPRVGTKRSSQIRPDPCVGLGHASVTSFCLGAGPGSASAIHGCVGRTLCARWQPLAGGKHRGWVM